MSQNLVYVLDNDQGLFSNSVRMFFAGIIRFLYNWISNFIDIMYHIAETVEFNEYAERIVDRLFNILIIFMVFRLTISLLSYIVDPDSFSDKSKGAASIIKRVIIAIVVLVTINPIFELMGKIQTEIINNGIVENLLMGSENDSVWYTDDGNRVYFTEISPLCETIGNENSENLKVATTSSGKHLALLTLKPFIQPIPENEGNFAERKRILYEKGYCGVDINSAQYVDASNSSLELSFGAFHNTSDYLQWEIYNGVTGDWSPENNVYLIDFNYFFALIVGIIVCLILISFCFDVVIRALTLILLKVIAPISAISYISPKGKSSEMLGVWGKKLFATWASLFIRILALSLAMSIISVLCENGSIKNDNAGMLEQLIIIIGALMFAKKMPQLLEELIPGLKLGGGFELNPFKRISKDALGGNMLLGAGAAIGGAALSGITNGVQRTKEAFDNPNVSWDRNAGFFSNIRRNSGAVARGMGTAVGSTVAGAARGGVNAFNRTRKDGHMFGGAWNGYQTAMYSKLLREENRRKGGTAAGAIAADLHRWTGTLTAGQREQIEAERMDAEVSNMEESLRQQKESLAIDKRNLAQEKHDRLEPYEEYSSYISQMKSRIDSIVDNNGDVKRLNQELERAKAIGDRTLIDQVQADLDMTKDLVKEDAFANDATVRHYDNRLRELQRQHAELSAFTYTKVDDYGETVFDAKVVNQIEGEKAIISDSFKDREAEFTVRERNIETGQARIDNYKNSDAYVTVHRKDSPAKTDNATLMNNKTQEAGHVFSYGQPAQSTLSQQSFFGGGLPGGNGGGPQNGGPGPGP